MSFSEAISPFLGRCVFVWFYGLVAKHIVEDWHGVAAQLAINHMPVPPLIMVLTLVLIVMGCLSLLFGYHTRHGAVILFSMTVTAAMTLHAFWRIADPIVQQSQFEIFVRDLAICGGLLVIIGMGCGPFGIHNRGPGGNRLR